MISDDHHDVLRGRHSNIPDCCIAFFVAIWWVNWKTPEGAERNDHYRLRARRFVRVHACTAACAGQPGASVKRRPRPASLS